MKIPLTEYTHSDRGAVGYQVFGEGIETIVLLRPWFEAIDSAWDSPASIRMLEFYASLGRVVILDHRGFGVSDPLPLDRVGNLDEMTYDVVAVLDAVAAAEATVVATMAACYVAVHLAAGYPERVKQLALLNPKRGGSYAVEPLGDLGGDTRARWGRGDLTRLVAAHLTDADRTWVGRHERRAAAPAVAGAMAVAVAETDVTDLLGQINTRVLVLHTGDVLTTSAHDARAVADRLPTAEFKEVPSSSFWWGPYTDELSRFITGTAWASSDRDLAAVVFTDIVDSTATATRLGDLEWRRVLAVLDVVVARHVLRWNGEVVKQTGDGHLLAFRRPSDAIQATRSIMSESHALAIQLRAGVHFAEVERREDGDLGGLGVHVAARVAELASADEILISRTVADVTAGGGFTLEDRGSHALKGIATRWDVYAVTP